MSYIYSVRILINHPFLRVEEITENMGVEPNFSWNFNDEGKIETMWSLVTWTERERSFFREIGMVVNWLEERSTFIKEINARGGSLMLIVQLSGKENIGDELSSKTMIRVAELGASIGVEVFPNLQRHD
jgi:hypothetical protein